MAQRVIAAALLVAGITLLQSRPLLSLIPLAAALVVFMNARRAFGSGMHRAVLGFVGALWLMLIGAVATLLGLVPVAPDGNFLLLPGLTVLGIAAVLFLGSLLAMWRIRRYRAKWPGEPRSRR